MAIREPDIYRIVEKIGDHYQNNINNRFMRKALLHLELKQSEWDRLDGLITNADDYKTQGFQLDDLYEIVLAASRFIFLARQVLVPNLKSIVTMSAGSARSRAKEDPEKDKTLREMAISNFPVNLVILTDLVNELYAKSTELDKLAHGNKQPLYEKIPELKEVARYLLVT